jgi:hypothetical protein
MRLSISRTLEYNLYPLGGIPPYARRHTTMNTKDITIKEIDDKIAYYDSVTHDTQMSEQVHLYALQMKTQLLQEKAQLQQKKIISSVRELNINGPMRIGNIYYSY